jgi:hypothetical protein
VKRPEQPAVRSHARIIEAQKRACTIAA